jgi:hypothetical protein
MKSLILISGIATIKFLTGEIPIAQNETNDHVVA